MTTIADLREWEGSEMVRQGGLIHVFPLFGKKHELSRYCWCEPSLDNEVCIHEPDN